ncbi:hypothetical protein ACFROC_21605 [Nocardia tengchongensis]|uniref:hypothetical protein n=1 Tax=Nocardia tengchongensis TaxID=2055889 RepID=UPI0036A91615
MTIDITTRAMTSDISPEYALREYRRGQAVWRLSWLPAHHLTHEQAQAGMELDEVLSDPAVVYDEAAQLWAADLATRLGIGVERAVILLAQRLAERLHREEWSEQGSDGPTAALLGWGRGAAVGHGAGSGARSQHRWR